MCLSRCLTDELSHWTLDTADISGTTIKDISGQHHDGTRSGTVTTLSGLRPQALQFDGNTAMIQTDTLPATALPGSNSYAFWINPPPSRTRRTTPSTNGAGTTTT